MIAKKKTKIVRKRKNIRKKKRGQSRSLREMFFILSVLSFFTCVIYVVFCSSLALIDHVEVYGIDRVDENSVTDRVKNALSGNVMGCIKNNNYFFVNESRVTEEIKKDERVKHVRIEKQFPNRIIATIVEYEIVPVWCVKSLEGKCYELRDGCVFRDVVMESDLVQKNEHFTVLDHGNDQIQLGQCVISQDDLNKIHTLGNELVYTLNVEIEQPFVINFRGSQEVTFTTDEGWEVLVDLTREIESTLEIAKLFVKKVELPTRQSDLSYIDLRFPERIFYKLKDGIEIEESSSDDEDSEEKDDK